MGQGERREIFFFCKIEWSLAYLIDLIRSLFPFWSPEEEAPVEEPQVALKVPASSIITIDQPNLIFRGLLPGRPKEKCIEREKSLAALSIKTRSRLMARAPHSPQTRKRIPRKERRSENQRKSHFLLQSLTTFRV